MEIQLYQVCDCCIITLVILHRPTDHKTTVCHSQTWSLETVEFANLKTAGKYAKKFGVINTIADLGMSVANYKMLGLGKYKTTTEISPISKVIPWDPSMHPAYRGMRY